MRLWTIQNQNIKRVLDNSVWNSSYNYRVKSCDSIPELEDVGYYPIYAFATLNHSYLNMDTLRRSIGTLAGKYFLPRIIASDLLVELEVGENDIISMKPTDTDELDPVFYYTSDYKKSINSEMEMLSYDGTSKYAYPESYECILKEIRKDQVVAMHSFHPDIENNCIVMNTDYTNTEVGYPSWTRQISITTEGEYRLAKSRDSDLIGEKKLYGDIDRLIRSKCAATKASSDMSVAEALLFLKADKRANIVEMFNSYKKNNKNATRFNTTVGDIFSKGNTTAEE